MPTDPHLAAYTVVFDITSQPYVVWVLPGAIGGAFLALGATVWLFGERSRTKVLAAVGFSVALIWTIFGQISLWAEYVDLTDAARQGRYVVVEGMVEDFIPAPPAGNGGESFTVAGHRFEIWSATATSAYHQTAGSGGIDLSNRCVRIHLATDEKIIWLGILPRCND